MPRMLVDPLREKGAGKYPDLVGCTGVTVDGVGNFQANRQGHIDFVEEKTASAMERQSEGFIVRQKFSGAGTTGATCTSCGFGAFRWQTSAPCPRCGGEIKEDE